MMVDRYSKIRAPIGGESDLSRRLDRMAQPGKLYRQLDRGRVECLACALRCRINAGGRGVCQVRYNRDGNLHVPWGYAASLQHDPVEKKPFYHVLPGEGAFTFGMLGCDMHCPYCQNWQISQTMRDASAGARASEISPEHIVDMALAAGARCLASSYNEPLISAEWGREIFAIGKKHDLKGLFVSNGNASEEVLAYLRPYMHAIKIDLKSMRAENYRRLGGVLKYVLEGIRLAVEMGFWVEVVTLVVPGFNDSEEELAEAAAFLAGLSTEIPWHLTAYFPTYKMTGPARTPREALVRGVEIGYRSGLHFVYAGNIPGGVGR
ncbi:MAG: AmmeMemoRadiSam system radical SAM enzyme, partial [Anaerolineae bacterium]|nr:AmmeMemoRadiSam system radical SAM enzyme [Anaerolineae bacterium]